MKNKFYNRIMGPVVLIIWGVIGWRMLVPEQTESAVIVHQTSYETPVEIHPGEMPELQLEYRDPFLNQLPGRHAPAMMKAASAPRSANITRIVAKPTVNYPKVSYLGGVRGNGSMTGLITIGKQFSQVARGDTISGLRVLDLSLHDATVAYADSVWKVGQRPKKGGQR